MAAETRKTPDRLGERIAARFEKLSPRLKSVVTYIDENRAAVMSLSALEIAAETDTSDATVIRAIQALGFEGLRDLKSELQHAIGGAMSSVEKMTATTRALNDDVNAAISYVANAHLEAAKQLASDDTRLSIINAIDLLKLADRIAVFGIGASGILADYSSRLFNRNGFATYCLNRTGIGLGEQLLNMLAGDVLLMMAQENVHREGATVLKEALRLRVPVILLTASATTTFNDAADVTIIAPRGQRDRFPIHGSVLMFLETIVLGLAAACADRSSESLQRLNHFHLSIRKTPRKF
ncbi:MurR/RpiR family transcriptional regulator [Rhizobium sp. 2MFCol3.1]|uniref:MurR/RpiR family transcriptional regulator n=1 Tax=Rhizobium sp. 2MFCol3.1 TaxID=1246459 RepID=UPI00035CF715|nr:MurR/RpiR family transcriptional regulator [Rhizobium sp. 2MFCol3.1]